VVKGTKEKVGGGKIREVSEREIQDNTKTLKSMGSMGSEPNKIHPPAAQ